VTKPQDPQALRGPHAWRRSLSLGNGHMAMPALCPWGKMTAQTWRQRRNGRSRAYHGHVAKHGAVEASESQAGSVSPVTATRGQRWVLSLWSCGASSPPHIPTGQQKPRSRVPSLALDQFTPPLDTAVPRAWWKLPPFTVQELRVDKDGLPKKSWKVCITQFFIAVTKYPRKSTS
jgi:hypothetical protein